MQYSFSLLHLYIYAKKIHASNIELQNTLHQAVLRLIQVLSELESAIGKSPLLESMIRSLSNTLIPLTKKQYALIAPSFLPSIYDACEQEKQEFQLFYPKIKRLYDFLIQEKRKPVTVDLENMSITSNELPIVSKLLRIFYQDGEPQFVDIEDEEIHEPEIPTTVRGNRIEDIAQIIQEKYVHFERGDVPVLQYHDLIINAGYNFWESEQIANFLEHRGIFIGHQLTQNPILTTIMKDLLDPSVQQPHLLLLDWDKFLPTTSKDIHEFCGHCGLPLEKSFVIYQNGQMKEACDICENVKFTQI
jgi:hypothetical protein